MGTYDNSAGYPLHDTSFDESFPVSACEDYVEKHDKNLDMSNISECSDCPLVKHCTVHENIQKHYNEENAMYNQLAEDFKTDKLLNS